MTFVTFEVYVPSSLERRLNVIVPFVLVVPEPDAFFPDGKVIVK